MFGLGIGEIALISFVVLAIVGVRRSERSAPKVPSSGMAPFGKVFGAGVLWAAASPALALLLRGQAVAQALEIWADHPIAALIGVARGGVTWMAAAWVVLRARRWSGGSLLADLAIIWFFAHLADSALWIAQAEITRGLRLDDGGVVAVLAGAFTYLPGVLSVAGVGVLAWVVRGAAPWRGEVGGVHWESYGGIVMSGEINHTTRFLAASAFLRGPAFRSQILRYFDDPNRAVAPELGVDLPLVVGVCQHAERRERQYVNIFFGLALVALILLALGMPPGVVFALIAVTAGGIWFQKHQQEREQIVQDFRQDRFDPTAIAARYPATADHIRPDAFPSETQNLIVYSGYSPFLSAGVDMGGWSFAVATDKVKEGFGKSNVVNPFTLRQLYAAVGQAIDRLRLPALDKRECFFVNGSDVRADRTILPHPFSRPVQVLDPEAARSYLDASDSRIRSYLWLKTQDWGGELVMSYFLRCSHRGPTLFVEIKKFLLTPLPASLREVDAIGPQRLGQKLALALTAAPIAGSLQVLKAPLVILERVRAAIDHWLGKDRQRQRLIEGNPLYNYGSGSSLRASLASGGYMHYFQHVDGDLYGKTLDREILDCLVGFLDDHNIDTSDLRERQSTILNSGIMVQGGNVQAESLAVGHGARATSALSGLMSRTATKAKSAATGAA